MELARVIENDVSGDTLDVIVKLDARLSPS
jgi:hypothetical protein